MWVRDNGNCTVKTILERARNSSLSKEKGCKDPSSVPWIPMASFYRVSPSGLAQLARCVSTLGTYGGRRGLLWIHVGAVDPPRGGRGRHLLVWERAGRVTAADRQRQKTDWPCPPFQTRARDQAQSCHVGEQITHSPTHTQLSRSLSLSLSLSVAVCSFACSLACMYVVCICHSATSEQLIHRAVVDPGGSL